MILRVAYLYLVNDCVVLVITGLFTDFVFCAVLKASYPGPFVFLVANDNPCVFLPIIKSHFDTCSKANSFNSICYHCTFGI